ncbi:RING finger protein, partial [Endozoicomonas sp. SESOKO2]
MRLFIFLVFNLILTISTGYADVCPICLHEINSDQQSTSLCCGHDFHEDCINTLRSDHRDLLCPVCRQRSRIHHGAESGDHERCRWEEPMYQALSRPGAQAGMIAILQSEPADPDTLAIAATFVKSQHQYPPINDTDRGLYETLSNLFFQRMSELSEADQWKSVAFLKTLSNRMNEAEAETQSQNQTETETQSQTQTETETQS